MHLVDRKTFLTLPAGTVYAKYINHECGSTAIKQATVADNDWTYTPLDTLSFIDAEDDGDLFNLLLELEPGASIDTEMENSYRDGLFDKEDKFLIYSQDDVKKVIDLLTQTLASTTNK